MSLLTTAGCGAGTGDVTGTVTYEGKTVASGTVVIAGSDDLPYYGVINEDGSYLVAKVPLGKARLAVVSPGPDDGKRVAAIVGFAKGKLGKQEAPSAFRGDPKKWFPLPKDCRDLDSSGLTMTVTSGVNRRDIDLKDKD
jgi:hypothetical protein